MFLIYEKILNKMSDLLKLNQYETNMLILYGFVCFMIIFLLLLFLLCDANSKLFIVYPIFVMILLGGNKTIHKILEIHHHREISKKFVDYIQFFGSLFMVSLGMINYLCGGTKIKSCMKKMNIS